MGVRVEKILFTNDFTATTTDYLIGNIGDKVTIEVDVTAEEIFVTNAKENVDRILLAPQDSRVGIPNTFDVIYTEVSGVFANYRVGDKLGLFVADVLAPPAPISGSTSYYEIYEIVSDNAVRVQSVGGGSVDFQAANGGYDTALRVNSKLFLATDLTSCKYRWNFIANSDLDTFNNKIDDQVNQARAGGLDKDVATPTDMSFDDPATNNYGSISIKGNGGGVNGLGQSFTIIHETIITPFFIGGKQFDLEDGISPDYLRSQESLKYALSVDIGREANDPNYIQTVDFSANEGNVGWFEENFNGNQKKYSVDVVRHFRQDLSSIDAVELTDQLQKIEIDVYSNEGTFSDTNTEFTLNLCVLPQEKDDHKNNGKTIVQNFRFDYAKEVVGSGTFSIGDNFGTTEQVFNKVFASVDTLEPTNKITITGDIKFSPEIVSDLTELEWDYFIWVSVADHTLDTEQSDRVSLRSDIQPFFVDLTDDGMITTTHNFLRHYETDPTLEGTTTPIVRTEDDVLVYQQFAIDKTGRLADDISILSVKAELVLKNTDGTESTLEEFTQSFSGTPIVGDSQYIDTSIDRAFKMPTNEQRKQIKVKRRTDLDVGDTRVYDFYYPFLFRWEYWLAKSGIDTSVFDPNEPNNGLSEDWQRMDAVTDHEIYFRTEVLASKNGNLQRYQTDTLLETYDYLEDTDWVNEKIELFDATTNDPLNGLMINPTKVVISKDYAGGTPPAVGDVEWVGRIEIHEQGGINDIRFLSSVYDWTEQSWLKSVDASNKVVKNVVGSTYTAEFLINHDALPSFSSFKISGRIYNESALAPIDPNAKLLEDGTVKDLENNETKVIE